MGLGLLGVVILFSLGSAYMSVQGAEKVYELTDHRLENMEERHQQKTDSVKTYYQYQNQLIQSKIEAIEKHKPLRWGGLLSGSENQQILNYQDQLVQLEANKQKALTLIENENHQNQRLMGEFIKHKEITELNFHRFFQEARQRLVEQRAYFKTPVFLIHHVAILSAALRLLREMKIDLPFTFTEAEAYYSKLMDFQQQEYQRMNEENRWWDILDHLIYEGYLEEDAHYKKHKGKLYLNARRVHPFYLKAYQEMYKAEGLPWINDRLKASEYFCETQRQTVASTIGQKVNFLRKVPSAMVFDWERLKTRS